MRGPCSKHNHGHTTNRRPGRTGRAAGRAATAGAVNCLAVIVLDKCKYVNTYGARACNAKGGADGLEP